MMQSESATTPEQLSAKEFPTQGKLLALDVGLARIGLALCDPLRLAARPHSTLTRGSRREDFARLAKLVKDEEVQGIVCGLPLNMDGTIGPQANTTTKWAMRLAHALRVLLGVSVPITFCDERLSSYSARELAQEWPRQGEDALAATVILQSFLAARKRGEPLGEVIYLPERAGSVDEDDAN